MGLLVSVYRNADFGDADCTNGGESSRVTRFVAVNAEGPFEASEDTPGIRIVPGNIPGTVKAVPVGAENKQVMFGGNYVGTSDSRFTELVRSITGSRHTGLVPIHDRVE